MIKYLKKRFISKIIDYYKYQIFSLSMEAGYNKHLSQKQIDEIQEEINEFSKIKEVLKRVSFDLLSGKF